jgi:hypothetical protein
MICYFITTVFLLLIPKSFVMLTRTYGKYQSWKENLSRELKLRDSESCAYYEKNSATTREWVNHIQSDFIFTMKAGFFRQCELANDASV